MEKLKVWEFVDITDRVLKIKLKANELVSFVHMFHATFTSLHDLNCFLVVLATFTS